MQLTTPTLLSDIASIVKNERASVAVRLAVVTAYTKGDLFATVRIGGSTSDIRARFINYDPVVNATVQVIQDGLDPIIIGEVGSTGPGLAVPIGLIAMWGNTVPDKWQRAEGQSTSGNIPLANIWGPNVPDLRYRFIQGAGLGFPVGTQGGNDQKTLDVSNMPSHSHAGTDHAHQGFNHTHGTNVKASGNEAAGFGLTPSQGFENRVRVDGTGDTTGADGGAYQTGNAGAGQTSSSGNGQPFDVRPTFYVVTFIVKVV